jgi:hypothetical protein
VTNPRRSPDDHLPESTPYGPHPSDVDEASGGADSSPFENLPSGEKAPTAERDKKAGHREPPTQAGDDRTP